MKQLKPRFYIFCNGERAEPRYFGELKDHLKARTIIIGCIRQCAPWELVEVVIHKKVELTKAAAFNAGDGDQCWCVFDVDEYWQDNKNKFKHAVKSASENEVQLAWSNECFELWYLLHFQPLSSTINRRDYESKLKKHFKEMGGKPYVKNCSVFDRIKDKQVDAIRHAKQIYKEDKVDDNPSTSVFKLVEQLFKHLG